MDKAWMERAARKVCEMRGFNPDELVSHGPPPDPLGMMALVLLRSPRWRLVANEVRAHHQVAQALVDTLPGE